MTEKEIYAELVRLTKAKDEWKERFPDVEKYLSDASLKICAKVT